MNKDRQHGNPHDSYFRKMMGNLEVAKQFFEVHLPQDILDIINLASIRCVPGSFIDENLKNSYSDILFAANYRDSKADILFLIEHLSQPNVLTTLRLLKYSINSIELYQKKSKTDALPVVYPMIYYNGRYRYCYTTSIFELFGDKALLAKNILTEKLPLIDLTQLNNNKIADHGLIAVMEYVMKNVRSRQHLLDLKTLNNMLGYLEKKRLYRLY